MKNAKITLIIQAALMYVAHIFFFIWFFIETEKTDSLLLLGIGAAAVVAAVICGTVGLILAAAGTLTGMSSPTKTTFIVKLALIPWYIFNMVYIFYIVAGSLNPFLLLAIPVEIAIAVFITYVLMLLTGIHNVFYVSKAIIKKRVGSSALTVLCIVSQFVFVLDVIGAVILHTIMKKADAAERSDRIIDDAAN